VSLDLHGAKLQNRYIVSLFMNSFQTVSLISPIGCQTKGIAMFKVELFPLLSTKRRRIANIEVRDKHTSNCMEQWETLTAHHIPCATCTYIAYIYPYDKSPILETLEFCDVNQNTQHQPTKTHLSLVCFCLPFPFGGNTHPTDSQNFATLPSRRQQRGSWIGKKKREGESRPFAEIRNGADMPGLRDNFETI